MSEMMDRLIAVAAKAFESPDAAFGSVSAPAPEAPSLIFLDGDFDLRPVVEAILHAMRKPTEAMIEAGERHTDSYYSEDGDFIQGWQAALNAALNPA